MKFFFESSIRSLRGGSGGGRGSGGGSYGGGSRGSYGGGSYGGGRFFPIWFYSSTTNSNGEGQDVIAVWVWIVLAIIIALAVGCCCYCMKKKSAAGSFKKVTVNKDQDFEAAVSEARRNLAYTSSPSSSSDLRYKSYAGTFDSTYSDRGKTLTAVLTLRLANDGISGYTIEGEGSDDDGITMVTDGFITYDGNAWWLEETLSGEDTGLKVLSKGTFDFSSNTFTGTWRSSSKFQGNYLSFIGRNIATTLPSSHGDADIPIVKASVEESIPIAVSAIPQYSEASAPSTPYILSK